ncbi:retinol dehydrogenase 14-like [Phyllopteryx taeniolatus]|uniref:retinol dehydrogenase 14-like n=1 Tax=Phyllopteryx taeniolatus TaxID=161469 RepID=UPI002AD3BD28|nr:retinol dehydrogenase 14-like [Phyllopteryx taeniolatus]
MMSGTTVIVTGANSGIGRATTAGIVKLGGRVIMACRDVNSAEEAAREIRQETDADSKLLVVKELDLASITSIRTFCQGIMKEEPRLDVLINNAGVYQCPYTKTEDGFELQFGVNHLGHFLLTHLLLDLMKRSAPSRIVVVSSKLYKHGHINFDDLNSEQNYDKAFAYSCSKLANLLFTCELAQRLEGSGVTVNALSPGIVRTNLGRHVHVPVVAKPLFNLLSWGLFKSPEQGAQTSLYLACSPDVQDVQGKFFSDCQPQVLLDKATNCEVASKLWDISEVLVGILK